MATQIQLTRSGTPGAQPTATEMELGELALNYADGKLYFKNDSNNIEQLNSTYNNSGQTIYVNDVDDYVGLNTTSPEYLLDLGGNSANADNTLRIHQANTGTAIRIGAGGGESDVTLIRVDGDSSNVSDGSSENNEFGFSLKYLGTGTGNNNKFVIMSDDSVNTDTQVMAFQVLQDGTIGMSKGTSFAPNTGVTLDVEDDIQVTGTTPSLRLHKTPGDDTHDQTWLAIGTNATDNAFEIQTRNSNGVFLSNDYRLIKNSSGALNHQWSIAGSEELRLDATGLGIGTTATEALTVNGDAAVNGTFTAGGIIQTTSGININSGGDITATNVTATGNVIASDPTADTHLATKAYVDHVDQPGQVIEMLSSFCNGSTLTGRPTSNGTERTFAWPDVTTGVNMDTTYRVYGSEISYQPPSNWNTIVFKYNCTTSDQSSHALFHVRAYIETGNDTDEFTEVTGFRSTGGYKDNTSRTTFQFNIQNNTTNLSSGQLLASEWTSERKLKLMFRTYSTSNLTGIHLTDHWDGSGTNMFSQPLLEVVAIA
jgi:hypothetical protein